MKHYKWVRQNEQTPDGKSHMRKSIKLVSTHHICSQGWWREMSSHQLQCTFNQVTQKFIWSMPKVDDIFSQLNGVKYFSTLDLWAGYHHIPLDESSIPKQHWPCHLENMNTSKYLLNSQKHQHISKNLWQVSCYCLPGWYHFQQNTLTTLSMFSKGYRMHTYQWNVAHATSSLKKPSTSDTSSAPQASDVYQQKPKP